MERVWRLPDRLNHQEMIRMDCHMCRRSPQLEMLAESDHFLCRAVTDHLSIAPSIVRVGSHVTIFYCSTPYGDGHIFE